MVELIIAPVIVVTNESTGVVDDQLGVIHQRQPTSGSVAKELVANTAEDAGDDFDQSRDLIILLSDLLALT